jgi:hypothetical protein
MTIFRSKPGQQTFRITNSGKRPLHVMTELWCEEFTIAPGDVLEGTAATKDLSDPLEPLNFEIWLEDDHVSLWCPYDTNFNLKSGSEK